MYYEYWDLKKPPFDNVPDPSMYVESHGSVETAISETLFAIEAGNECISVIVGDAGTGKTMTLRMIMDSLEQEKYKIAFITNPDMSFVQLLREIIGQLTQEECEAKRKIELLDHFKKFLFETIDEGKKVLIFIDEANAISPANLESLRLLTNMQDESRNLFSIVLSGQMELAERLEHPKRVNLLQRIGSYNRIDKIQSEDLIREYVGARLKLAGGTKKIFSDDVYTYLWEYSDHGIPSLVNKICKLSLKAGETKGLHEITGDVIKQVGERFERLVGPAIQKRRPRKRTIDTVVHEQTGIQEDKQKPILAELREKREAVSRIQRKRLRKRPADEEAQKSVSDKSDEEQPRIGRFRIGKIGIPSYIIHEAKSTTKEHRLKLAGVLAAQTLKKYPQLLESSPSADPITVWNEARNLIYSRIEQEITTIEEQSSSS